MRAPEVVRAADSPEQFVEAIVTRLFRGTSLTAEQASAVRSVVADVVARQEQIDAHQRGGWNQLLDLNVERNAVLAALLTSERERAIFESNAAETQLEQAEIAWRAQTTYGR